MSFFKYEFKRKISYPKILLLILFWSAAIIVINECSGDGHLRYIIDIFVGALAIISAAYDWKTFRLPFFCTAGNATVALAGYSLLFDAGQAIGGLFGFFIIFAAMRYYKWRYGQDVLGTGDCVFMIALGAMLGPVWVFPGIAVAIILCGLFAMSRNHSIPCGIVLPFGPFLAAGSLAITLFNRIYWLTA